MLMNLSSPLVPPSKKTTIYSFFYGSVEWSHMPGSDSIEIKTEQVRIEMRINGPA